MRKHYRSFHQFSNKSAPDCEKARVERHTVHKIKNIDHEPTDANDIDDPPSTNLAIQAQPENFQDFLTLQSSKFIAKSTVLSSESCSNHGCQCWRFSGELTCRTQENLQHCQP